MVVRYFGNLALGFLIGALTSELCGQRVTDYAAEGARKMGSAARQVVDAFRQGFAAPEPEPEAGPTRRPRRAK
ncbi:MAG TPA: hypothetical protein PLD23_09035 [Armatimonadota bacterium]|nr:hypothetical protein [Armatimonadota bacterium]HQK93638.1 hypothetical protein [Armatimonadota bacterium]